MNTNLLLWLALLAITGLAIVLYLPRKFSGPLTSHERRTAHRGLRHLSLLLTLSTPLATVLGLALLVPPPVVLEVRSPFAASNSPLPPIDRPLLAHLSWRMSTRPWTESALCHALDSSHHDDRALAEAIVAAAHAGFPECRKDQSFNMFDARQYRSVELSLVELAARAYAVTEVELHTGPRLRDPDPWDVMAGSLEQRGITVNRFNNSAATSTEQIVRLSRARDVDAAAGTLDVLALVHGSACTQFTGRVHAEGREVASCTLQARPPCEELEGTDQRVLWMTARCGPFTASDTQQLALTAGSGETRLVRPGPIPVSGKHLGEYLAAANGDSNLFDEEIRSQDLLPIVAAEQADISVDFKSHRILVRGEPGIPEDCSPPSLDQGPFSWSGMEQPPIEVRDKTITIDIASTVFDPQSTEYDPSAFYATLSTIAWAANSLKAGQCLKLAEPRPPASPTPAHPVLTASQLDAAAAALGRPRETAGLVLLALAILSLALGLRRSVH